MLREAWKSVLGRCGKVCWGVEKCRKRCGESVGGSMLGFPMPPPHLLSPPIHPNIFPNPSPYPTISTYLPHTPTHFPTHPISPYLPRTPTRFPTPLPQLLLLPPHLSLPPPHPNTLFYISPHISLHLSQASQHPPHSILTTYTIPHFKKIMLKCFYIRFKPKKYVDTIVPMLPVKSVKKNKIQYASNA